jgi:hypothetical protein
MNRPKSFPLTKDVAIPRTKTMPFRAYTLSDRYIQHLINNSNLSVLDKEILGYVLVNRAGYKTPQNDSYVYAGLV